MWLWNRNRSVSPNKDFWLRRFSLLGKVLPTTTELKSGEHIQGAILRAAASNRLPDTQVIIELAGASTFRNLSAFTALEDTAEIERLVDVLGIRYHSEQLLEVLKAPGTRTREHVSFFGHVVRRAHISPHRRVSPRALAIQGYQRAIWSLRPLEFDPGTREMLLSHCPKCDMALGWAKTAGVEYCEWCPARSVDLRNFPQKLIEPKDEEAIEFVGDLVNPEVSDIKFAKWKLAALSNVSRGDLFQLLVKAASECQRAETGSYSTSIGFKHLEQAGRAVLGWPKSFVALAEAILPNQGSVGGSNQQPLWRLKYDPTLNAEVREQLKTMHHNSRNRSIAARSDVFGGRKDVPAVHSEKRLRSPQVELKRLMDSPSGATHCEVETKIKVLRNTPEVQRISSWLGLPVFDVYELYTEGLLPELTARLSDCGFPEPAGQSSAPPQRLLEAIPINSSSRGTNLASARFALDPHLAASWSRIFEGVSKGELSLSRCRPSGRGIVRDLYVEDFVPLGGLLDAEQHNCLPSTVTVTQSEFAMSMGKAITTAARFVHLTGLASGLTLGRIREERANWITSFELRILLQQCGIDSNEMINLLRSASVPFKNHRGVSLWARPHAIESLGLQ